MAHLLGMLGRQRFSARLGRAGDLEQGDAAVGAENGEPAGVEGDILDRRLQHLGRDRLRLPDHQLGGAPHDDAGHAHRARGMRPAALRDDVGVAGHQPDAVEGNAEPVGDALGERGLVPLPARKRADHNLDPALRKHVDPGPLDGKPEVISIELASPMPRSRPRAQASSRRAGNPSQSASRSARSIASA